MVWVDNSEKGEEIYGCLVGIVKELDPGRTGCCVLLLLLSKLQVLVHYIPLAVCIEVCTVGVDVGTMYWCCHLVPFLKGPGEEYM